MSWVIYEKKTGVVRSIVFSDQVTPVVKDNCAYTKIGKITHDEAMPLINKVFDPEAKKFVEEVTSNTQQVSVPQDKTSNEKVEDSTSETTDETSNEKVEDSTTETTAETTDEKVEDSTIETTDETSNEKVEDSVSPTSYYLQFSDIPANLEVGNKVTFKVGLKDSESGESVKGCFIAKVSSENLKISKKRKFKEELEITVSLKEEGQASITVEIAETEALTHIFNA